MDATIALFLCLGALVLYATTMCRTIYVEDSAEFATAAATFGVPHPPGYPLYTMVAGLFVRIFQWGDLGLRTNAFSALCGSIGVAIIWTLLRRLQVSRPSALGATIAFATGRAFWSECLAAEVHSLNVVLLASTLLLVHEAILSNRRIAYVLAGLFTGLVVSHRNLNALYLAAAALTLPKGGARIKNVLSYATSAFASAAAVYVYVPLAAARHPRLNMGNATTPARLWTMVSAEPYFRHLSSGSLSTAFGRVRSFFLGLPLNLGVLVLALPMGAAFWYRRRREGPVAPRWVAPIGALVFCCFFFGAIYNVLDVASYFIPAYLGLALIAGIGLDRLEVRWRWAFALLSLLAIPFSASAVSLRETTLVRDYAISLLASAPEAALVISFADTETHVLGYMQAVEDRRRDLVVVSANEIDGWYIDELARRYPAVKWPASSRGFAWLSDLIGANTASRPICMTQPLELAPPNTGLALIPVGLLYCFGPQDHQPEELKRSLAFWNSARVPSPADLVHPDVHIQMIAFSYDLARFLLAGHLVRVGYELQARAQLEAMVVAHPDQVEGRIAEALKTIGMERPQRMALEDRARRALTLAPGDPRFESLLKL